MITNPGERQACSNSSLVLSQNFSYCRLLTLLSGGDNNLAIIVGRHDPEGNVMCSGRKVAIASCRDLMLGMPVTKNLLRFGPDPRADVQTPYTIASREWLLGHDLLLLTLRFVDDQTCQTRIFATNQYVGSGRSFRCNAFLVVYSTVALPTIAGMEGRKFEDTIYHSTLTQDRNADSRSINGRHYIMVQDLGSRRRHLLQMYRHRAPRDLPGTR